MKELILSKKQIEEIAIRMGGELTEALSEEEKPPVFICIMKGGLNFFAELIKNIKIDLVIDYIQTESYRGSTSTNQVTIVKHSHFPVEGRTVVVVDDCVDTGLTAEKIVSSIEEANPKAIFVACLIDKISVRKVKFTPDFVGYTMEDNKFIAGFGLDYKGLGRNYPYVFVPDEEEIASWERLSN